MVSETVQAETQGLTVSVLPILPDNQLDKTKTYFDLLVEPGQIQDLEVTLKNSSDKDIIVITNVNTATTNDNGVVDYSKVEPEIDSTLKHPLGKLATVDEEQKVPANSEVNMKVKVESPKETFKGILVGGLYLSEKEIDTDKTQSKGVQIKNKYTYIVGIQLRNQELISEVIPELNLDKKKIKPKQINFRNYIGINLQNSEPTFIRKLTVSAKVYKAGSTEVLYEQDGTGMKMAPNSNFNFGVTLNNTRFVAGNYRAIVTAKAEDFGKEWNWEETFTIDADEAKKLNDQAVELEEEASLPLWVLLLIGFGTLLLVLLIVYMIMNNRKKKKEIDYRRKRKKKR